MPCLNIPIHFVGYQETTEGGEALTDLLCNRATSICIGLVRSGGISYEEFLSIDHDCLFLVNSTSKISMEMENAFLWNVLTLSIQPNPSGVTVEISGSGLTWQKRLEDIDLQHKQVVLAVLEESTRWGHPLYYFILLPTDYDRVNLIKAMRTNHTNAPFSAFLWWNDDSEVFSRSYSAPAKRSMKSHDRFLKSVSHLGNSPSFASKWSIPPGFPQPRRQSSQSLMSPNSFKSVELPQFLSVSSQTEETDPFCDFVIESGDSADFGDLCQMLGFAP